MAISAERQPYFTILDREHYTAPAIFEQEYERVLSRQWIYVAHLSQIPSKGDFITREIAGESMIVVRGEGGAVHALFNVCRHRGSRLCDAQAGSFKGRIVCPYHQWSYGFDGRLLSVPRLHEGQRFDFGELGLQQAYVEVWHGLIFVNLSPGEPRSLSQLPAGVHDPFAPFAIERTKVAHEIVYDVECNWKVLVENFCECYHCHAGHPALCKTLDVTQILTNWEEIENYEVTEFVTPLHPGKQTASTDGRLVVEKLLGDGRPASAAGHDASGGAGIVLLPVFFYTACWVDHVYLTQVFPVSPVQTRKLSTWFVHEDAEEGRDYDVARVIELLDIAVREDIELSERAQRGVSSRRFVPGPINAHQEPLIRGFLQTYERWMGAAA